MIKLVALDWNGTLLADTTAQWRAGNKSLQHFGHKPVSLRQFRETYEIPIAKAWLANGGREDEVGPQHPIYQAAYEKLERKIRTRAGSRELLKHLHGSNVSVIIFSNHPTPHIWEGLERLGLKDYITEVLGRAHDNFSHMTERSKQQRLQTYVEIHKLKPKEIVCIGDTGEEIDIAKHLGYYCIALTGGNYSTRRLKALQPHFLIHKLSDAIQIIHRLNSNAKP